MPKIENLNGYPEGDWSRFSWFDAQLKANKYPSASSMAVEFGISQKAAHDTIKRFENQFRAPIDYDPSLHGYYYVGHPVQLPPLWLTSPQAGYILSSIALLNQHLIDCSPDFSNSLLSLLPGKYRNLKDRIFVEIIGHHPPENVTFTQLIDALLENRQLQVVYQGIDSNSPLSRTIEPHVLYQFSGNWYCFGYCLLRQAHRTFALDRIITLEVLNTTFEPPNGKDCQEFLQRSFGIFKAGEVRRAKIRFSAYLGRWIKAERWHIEQQVKENVDGSIELTLPFAGNGFELIQEVMKYGSDAEILEPEDLRTSIRCNFHEALKNYEYTPEG